MALSPGTRIGSYEIVSLLGAGGMGEVYRAKDTKLGRDIALKVLPDSVANDAERLARFEREAKVLAALNHPNIAHIHGFEDSTGVPALVMELVEGPTLADRIARGPIPIDDALAIARQIAEALESAHEQGIIHRDLKPANIKVRDDGAVKVLDFGLAKAIDQGTGIRDQGSRSASMSPTITTPAMMTGVGVILGTAAYMSPEQAKGRSADKRSDIWAFGCVLYEMLAGKRAFEGEDVSDTLAAVLRGEPDWQALPHDVPAHIRSMITRCLDKTRQSRVSDIAVTRYVLAEPAGPSGSLALASARRPALTRAVTASLGIAALSMFAAGWFALRPAAPSRVQPVRFVITPAQGVASLGTSGEMALSPDGSRLAYASGIDGQLIVRSLDQLDAAAVPGVRGARAPFFSPDGRSIGFFTLGELKRVNVGGGPVSVLCRTTGPPLGATWMPDDTIAFAMGNVNGIHIVPAGGGEPKPITKVDFAQGEQNHRHPSALPDGSNLLFTIVRSDGTAQVAVVNVKSGRQTTLVRDGRQAEYLEAGYLVYALRGTLQAVRFDPSRLMVSGDRFPVAEHIRTSRGGTVGTARFAASRNGVVAFVPGSADGDASNSSSMVWVDRRGAEEPLPAPERPYVYPRISPDGTRIAVDIQDQDQDIWVWDLARRFFTRLTFDAARDSAPVWTSDGRHIVFNSVRAGPPNVYRQAADGTGTVERLTTSPRPQFPFAVSPDGTILLREDVPGAGNDLAVLRPGGPGQATQLVHLPPGENNADLSPDGRWIAYQAQASAGYQIYVRPFPNIDGGTWQISTSGGSKPVWSRTGRELFYLGPSASGATLTSVAVQTTSTFSAGPPARVLETPYFNNNAGRTYDVSPDGQRFLMIKDVSNTDGPSTSTSIVVMLNWLDELKARAAK